MYEESQKLKMIRRNFYRTTNIETKQVLPESVEILL